MYILSIIRKTLTILKAYSLYKYFSLQFFYLVSALVQVLGVASIAPFIGILSNPGIIKSNEYLFLAYNYFKFADETAFIIAFAVLTMILIIISNVISGITLWLTFRFSVGIGEKVQKDLFENYIYRGYLFHKTNNYNETIALIQHEAKRFIYLVLIPFLLFTSHSLLAIIILSVLLFVDYSIAISSGLIVGSAYLVTYYFLRKFLSRHGGIVTRRNMHVQSILSESFIGIKDMKIRSLEERYVQQFASANIKGLVSESLIALAGDIPKLVVESIAFSALLMFAVLLLSRNINTENIVGMLSLYAVAGYKLLPTMQQIYKAATNISANGIAASKVLAALREPTERRSGTVPFIIEHIHYVKIVDACFTYIHDGSPALADVNTEFKIGTINTIVGPSGSGKTTLVDLLMGLLPLSKGNIIVNDKILSKDEMQRFKCNVSYVPQHVYLTDEDVISNVAFGLDRDEVDYERVNKALKNANAIDFVGQLSERSQTKLGQNGQLLSGGQRQKIGIARALYHNAPLLVLDEPTSALDIESEFEIMELLHKLKNDILIIVISHRPAAIKMSDNIALMKGGKIIDQGSYDELVKNNDTFRALLKKGSMD